MNASENSVRIKVVGVGGAGCNAVDRMMQIGITGIDYIAANTDAQALSTSAAPTILPLGPETTRCLGAGGNPEVGRKAAEESKEAIAAELNETDMLFIAAGMGGGTGTGAAPVIAEIARQKGILTIGVVSQPFSFEGTRRAQSAREGMEKLKAQADTLIVVPNDKLLKLCDKMSTFDEALRLADDVLRQAVQGIAELITHPGLINLDFASVRSILHQAGTALFSIGYGEGENKALAAAQAALENPLLDIRKTQDAAGLLVNMTGGTDLTLFEVNETVEYLGALALKDAQMFFGTVINPEMEGKVQLILIATGIGKEQTTLKSRPASGGGLSGPRRSDDNVTPFLSSLPRPRKIGEPKRPPQTSGNRDEDSIPAFLRRRTAES